MSELHPAPFTDLVERIHLEFTRQRAVFDFPQNKWFVPDPNGPDLSVRPHGRLAANPLGPAAGPHTQMAQNIVLGWLAGSVVMVVGYFLAEVALYGAGAAIVEVPGNCIQAVAGGLVAIPLAAAIRRAWPPIDTLVTPRTWEER